MSSPWFKFPYRYINSPFFGNQKFDHLYMWLASKVANVEHGTLVNGKEIILRPGQIIVGRLRASMSLGFSGHAYLNRIEALEKGQLLDRKRVNGVTLITLICPDTYEWQKEIYTKKGDSKSRKNGTPTGQGRDTIILDVIDDIDVKKKEYLAGACAHGEEEDMRADEVGPSSVDIQEAVFSEYKDKILAIWKCEREEVDLIYVRSPKNDRAAVYAAAMIENGEWSLEIIEKAIKFLMAAPERFNYTLMGLLENIELWANGGPKYDHGSAGRNPSRTNQNPAKRREYTAEDFGDVVTGEHL